jgi:hypothetical protein
MAERYPQLARIRSSWIPFSWLFLLLVFTLASCSLDRSGLAWETDVNPNLVCPGDIVTIHWDTLDTRTACVSGCSILSCPGSCPDAIQVSISSNPGGVLPALSTYEQRGTYLAMIMQDTTFTFRARDDDNELVPYDHDVRVILPQRETTLEGTFEGVCSGLTPTWTELTFPDDIVRSENVHVLRICNNNRFSIRLILEFSSGVQAPILDPGDCVSTADSAFPSDPISVRAVPLDPTISVGAACTPTRAEPPHSFTAEVTLTCDMD